MALQSYVDPDQVVQAVPEQTLRWELYGAGLDSLGEEDAPSLRPVPTPGAGELLVRVDACGICFSDIKIINLGGDHPRLQGRDLRADPVVMGHEVSVTVVATGPNAPAEFPIGQRAIVQADIYVRGENRAFGYRIPGGFSQYALIPREVLAGDEGCYLLPVDARLGHAEAGLCEPWACVEASYLYQPRTAPLAGGEALLVLLPDAAPRFDELRLELPALIGRLTVSFSDSDEEIPKALLWNCCEASEFCLCALDTEVVGASGCIWDDIIVVGTPTAELVERLSSHLKPKGTLCLLGGEEMPTAQLDIGGIHYQGLQVIGSPGLDVMEAYAWQRTAELTPGGAAWFIGAGGPLGQMHLSRALTLPTPPSRIVATQNTGARLEDLRQRFEPLARSRGVELTLLDPKAMGPEALDEALRAAAPGGFTDIACIVPNVAVVEESQRHLGPSGGYDIFAGVPVGTTARIDLNAIVHRGARFWGTSGSSIADLRSVLRKVEQGELATDSVVAAVGGIRTVKEGLAAVRDARYLGKTLIYPQLTQLPLLSIEECAQRYPTVGDKLTQGRYWNREAEAELFRLAQ